MNLLAKALLWLLPGIVAEMTTRIRRLRALGLRTHVANLTRSGSLLANASTASLDLLPTGAIVDLKVVVDVGANVGSWSRALLACCNPSTLILCEPVPECVEIIVETLGRYPGVEVHEVVVGDKNRKVKFNITSDPTGASVLDARVDMEQYVGQNWRVDRVIEREMKKLDTLLSSHTDVSLIKIDVQGLEEEVLDGSTAVLRKTRFVLIELNFLIAYQGGSDFARLHERLTNEFNFKLVGLGPLHCLAGEGSHVDALYANRSS